MEVAGGEGIKSCAVITCEPNATIGSLHDRMPVILDERDWSKWLGEEPAAEEEIKALLVPCPDERLMLSSSMKKMPGRDQSPS